VAWDQRLSPQIHRPIPMHRFPRNSASQIPTTWFLPLLSRLGCQTCQIKKAIPTHRKSGVDECNSDLGWIHCGAPYRQQNGESSSIRCPWQDRLNGGPVGIADVPRGESIHGCLGILGGRGREGVSAPGIAPIQNNAAVRDEVCSLEKQQQ
jgi:hypothetical protein